MNECEQQVHASKASAWLVWIRICGEALLVPRAMQIDMMRRKPGVSFHTVTYTRQDRN